MDQNARMSTNVKQSDQGVTLRVTVSTIPDHMPASVSRDTLVMAPPIVTVCIFQPQWITQLIVVKCLLYLRDYLHMDSIYMKNHIQIIDHEESS